MNADLRHLRNLRPKVDVHHSEAQNVAADRGTKHL